mmetsp:Transcript_6882/g.15688  ORF Transcript_6882/g.15688 Transcript_6882/m.15688 type:complete len:241 (+) Transcript_6882:189-911(+)
MSLHPIAFTRRTLAASPLHLRLVLACIFHTLVSTVRALCFVILSAAFMVRISACCSRRTFFSIDWAGAPQSCFGTRLPSTFRVILLLGGVLRLGGVLLLIWSVGMLAILCLVSGSRPPARSALLAVLLALCLSTIGISDPSVIASLALKVPAILTGNKSGTAAHRGASHLTPPSISSSSPRLGWSISASVAAMAKIRRLLPRVPLATTFASMESLVRASWRAAVALPSSIMATTAAAPAP